MSEIPDSPQDEDDAFLGEFFAFVMRYTLDEQERISQGRRDMRNRLNQSNWIVSLDKPRETYE